MCSAELLLDGRLNSGGDRGIRPRVLVTVPALTLLGVSDEPATLEGYGPIDHDTAMRLAATAPLHPASHAPRDGCCALGGAR